MTTTFLSIFFGAAGTLIALITGIFELKEYLLQRKINKATLDSLPILISKSITFQKYFKGLQIISTLLQEQRFIPDYIIGIHYGGTIVAAELGKIQNRPFLTVNVHYHTVNKMPVCDNAIFNFDPKLIVGKKVLIVDNGLSSGKTLSVVLDRTRRLKPQMIKSLVVYEKNETKTTMATPDYVLFKSKKPLKYLIR